MLLVNRPANSAKVISEYLTTNSWSSHCILDGKLPPKVGTSCHALSS